MNFLRLLKVIVFSIFSVLFAALFCFYFFGTVQTLSYRLAVIFLALIFISNFNAKLLITYFQNKK
jgi:hypothetical protein